MKKTVLVTGANGYIGSHLVTALCELENQFAVIATDLHNTHIDGRAHFIPFDLFSQYKDGNCLRDFFQTPDICVHLAWQNGFNHNLETHINSLPIHFHFLKTLVEQGTSHIAVAGSFREYGSIEGKADETARIVPDNFYTLAKTTLKDALTIYLKGSSVCFQWLRPFTVYGDDHLNNSILSKILAWEKEGKTTFPFTDGNEEYDYVHVNDLANQIVAIISQREVDGVIDCCSGHPTKLKTKVEEFIAQNGLHIRPEYGAFKTRDYDPKVIYGDTAKLEKILAGRKTE